MLPGKMGTGAPDALAFIQPWVTLLSASHHTATRQTWPWQPRLLATQACMSAKCVIKAKAQMGCWPYTCLVLHLAFQLHGSGPRPFRTHQGDQQVPAQHEH